MGGRRACHPPRLGQPDLGLEQPRRQEPGDTQPGGDRCEGGTGTARRYLALHIPDLPVARLRRDGVRGPVVVWRAIGSRREVVAAGEAEPVHAGQPLGDARAIRPDAVAIEDDAERNRAFLDALALWATRFTPLVATSDANGLVLDITGSTHLFGGEAATLRRVRAGLTRLAVPVVGAVAGAPGTAMALVRAGCDGEVVPPGDEARAVAGLPLSALGLDPDLVAGLARVGIRRIGEARRQPRGPLARRFGAATLLALDEAAGEASRPISPIRPPPDLEASRDFLEPLITRPAIDAAVEALLRDLCARLVRAGVAARRVTLRAYRVDGAVQEMGIGTGLATRDATHLGRLFAHKLERLEPGFGFDRMALAAEVTEPLTGTQPGLSREPGAEALAQLLDRLAGRVALSRLAPQASRWPEREARRVSAFAVVAPLEGWAARPRPVRLLRDPVRVGAMALLPDAPPALLRIGSRSRRVLHARGPERLAIEWWHDERPERDYYRVELEDGARLWVCRIGFGAEARWFIHGHFG